MTPSFRFRTLVVALFAIGSFADVRAQDAVTTSAPIAMCTADRLSLGIDTENGAFDAMSRSGALLVLRNVSSAACRLEAMPHAAFFDAKHEALAVTIERDSAFGGPASGSGRVPMGHGPVALPLALAAGAEATATLHWVAGDVYEHSVCVTTAFV